MVFVESFACLQLGDSLLIVNIAFAISVKEKLCFRIAGKLALLVVICQVVINKYSRDLAHHHFYLYDADRLRISTLFSISYLYFNNLSATLWLVLIIWINLIKNELRLFQQKNGFKLVAVDFRMVNIVVSPKYKFSVWQLKAFSVSQCFIVSNNSFFVLIQQRLHQLFKIQRKSCACIFSNCCLYFCLRRLNYDVLEWFVLNVFRRQ